MARGSFNFFEVHAEKFVLGLTALFTLAMGWMYLLGSPNTIDFQNRPVGPSELDAEIARSAEQMQSRAKSAAPETAKIASFSEDLRREQTAGILGAGDPAAQLPAALRLAANFGKPIAVPGLDEETEATGQITLVTPLAPTPPVVRVGRSVAIQAPLAVPGLESPEKPADGEKPAKPVEESTEFAWVSVGAYFDKKAQQDEMSTAHYAPVRTKVYVAGVDVQRQEMQADGEFSDWRDVAPSKATVNIPVPDPVVDDKSHAVVNKEAIERAFVQVKSLQQYIMQPPFYDVEVGDHWEVPPLEGLGEDAVDESDKSDTDSAAKKAEKARKAEERAAAKRDKKQAGAGRGPAISGEGPRGGPRGGGGGGIGMEGGGPRMRGGGTAPQPSSKAEAKKQALEDLKEARAALREKDYAKVLDHANRVASNPDLDGATVKQAERLVADAKAKLEKERGSAGIGGGIAGEFGGPRSIRGVASEGGPRAPSGVSTESLSLVTHPKKPAQPAVWFHDDSVSPGKTYRYRMRVRLYNRYVGQPKPLRDPSSAMHTVLLGDWSRESEPVSVTPSTHFFVNSAKPDKSGARVDVYKWRQGSWIKKSFDVNVGDVIGGMQKIKTEEEDDKGKPIYEDVDFSTGAVVLDLRFDEPVDLRTAAGKTEFNYRARPSLVMVYLEPADGQVKERILDVDKVDPLKKKLDDSEG